MSISVFILLLLQLFMYFDIFSKFQLKKLFATDKLLDIIVSGASMVAQLVKNPPAVQETPVRFLGQKDPSDPGSDLYSQNTKIALVLWPGEFHGLQSMGSQSWTQLSNFHFTLSFQLILYNSF